MEIQEIKIREDLCRQGYKLKAVNNGYLIKSEYSDKVVSPALSTLEEVQLWLDLKVEKERVEKANWDLLISEYSDKVKYPEYGSWCDELFRVFDEEYLTRYAALNANLFENVPEKVDILAELCENSYDLFLQTLNELRSQED